MDLILWSTRERYIDWTSQIDRTRIMLQKRLKSATKQKLNN